MTDNRRYIVYLVSGAIAFGPLWADDDQPHLAEQLPIKMVLATSTATDVSSAGPGLAIS